MVLVAGSLVLAGLGLFVAGVLTGDTTWYWACVVACALAVVVLVAARSRASAGTSAPAGRAEPAPARSGGRGVGTTDGATGEATGEATGKVTGEVAARPARVGGDRPAADAAGDPAEEDVEFTDLLIVVDLTDEVLVVDEHPRYHRADCRWLAGRETIPLPVAEARTDGFTPCAVCGPDASLATVERARRAARRD